MNIHITKVELTQKDTVIFTVEFSSKGNTEIQSLEFYFKELDDNNVLSALQKKLRNRLFAYDYFSSFLGKSFVMDDVFFTHKKVFARQKEEIT